MSLAILCSGQGAQSSGLFTGIPFTRKGLAIKELVLAANVLPADVTAWLDDASPPPDQIFLNHFSQPLICLYHAMVWAELEPLLPTPVVCAGYSLGELSAYGCAEAFGPVDWVRLACLRSALMDSAAPPGEMIAVTGLPVEEARACGHVAIVLAEDHCVVGCLADRAQETATRLLAAGAGEARILHVTVAAHTPILDAAVEPFREALVHVGARDPGMPVLAGVSAAKVIRRSGMEEWLPEQIHRTIRWDQIQQRLIESECRVVLELGPGDQLAHAATRLGANARGLSEFHSFEGAAEWVQSALVAQN